MQASSIRHTLRRGQWASIARLAGIVCACLALGRACLALDIPAEHHPWGRFQPGSWARTRLTRFEIGADGGEKVAGVTVTTTRLEKVVPEGVTLTVETATDGGA